MISLWQTCFGDDKQTVDSFFDSPAYESVIPLVYCENGEIISQLFLIDGEVRDKNLVYPSYYLYAACTAPSYRGRGIMGRLIEAAKETAAANSRDFIFLKPSEEHLYTYYSKFGFVNTCKFQVYDIDYLRNNPLPFDDIPVFYSRACRDFACGFADASGGEFACEFNEEYGFAQYEISDGVLCIIDIDISSGATDYAVFLSEKNNCPQAFVTLPCPGDFSGSKHGMVCSCTGKEIPENVFLNFTLD